MKFRLLLLDANIVIYLHERGLWDRFIQRCSVTLTSTVVQESKFWEDEQGVQYPIDLTADIDSQKIQTVDVDLKVIQDFSKKYGPVYLDRLDPGEADSLAFLMTSREEWIISSADEIVFKVLGLEGRTEQGLSLEEILDKIGLTQSNLKRQYRKAFRESAIRKGQYDGITDFGHSS